MPFYEYQCTKCGHEEEILQKVDDKPLKKCPACGKLTMKKLVSAAAFRLKGGGWYETDFKSGGKKNVAADENAGNSADKTADKNADKPVDKKAGKDNAADAKAGNKTDKPGKKTGPHAGQGRKKSAAAASNSKQR